MKIRTRISVAGVLMSIILTVLAVACGPNQAGTPPPSATAATARPSASATAAVGASNADPKPGATAASLSPQPAAPSPSAANGSSAGRWTFDTDAAGTLPGGAQVFSGQWAVRAEPGAPSPPNALCQTGQADFPAIGLDSRPMTDVTMVTKFKPISGREDQAGGLIFRVQDKDNYYIVRANALEDNVIFFIYQNGRRSQLKGAGGKVENGQWHDLRVEVRGSAFTAFLDGKQVVDVTDDRYKTGGVGLWTKSDSVTCFDDVQVTAV